MNYKNIYDSFIKDRKKKQTKIDGYYENHHILPRSLGGDDSFENIIKLTASDHFFAHLLLSKIYGGGMSVAIFLMSVDNSASARGYKAKRWAYDYAKKAMSKAQSERYMNDGNPFYGKKHSDKTKSLISASRIGKYSGKDHHFFGKPSPSTGVPVSDHVKLKISKANTGEKNGMYGATMSKNPNYNSDVVVFRNKHCGTLFKGTQRELINTFKLEFRNVSAVVAGKRKTCGGWQVIDL